MKTTLPNCSEIPGLKVILDASKTELDFFKFIISTGFVCMDSKWHQLLCYSSASTERRIAMS